MKWTDDSSSGVSSKRFCSWRPAWEGMSAMAGFAGSITTAIALMPSHAGRHEQKRFDDTPLELSSVHFIDHPP